MLQLDRAALPLDMVNIADGATDRSAGLLFEYYKEERKSFSALGASRAPIKNFTLKIVLHCHTLKGKHPMRYAEIMKLLDLLLTAIIVFMLFWIISHAKAEPPLDGPAIARSMDQLNYLESRGLKCRPAFLPGHVQYVCGRK